MESVRIATIDRIVNTLDDAREAAGLSKAELARAIQVEPATIRRLFASATSNPTLGTLAEVAAALGLRITVEPLDRDERAQITEALLVGRTADPVALARYLGEVHGHGPKALAWSSAERSRIARPIRTSEFSCSGVVRFGERCPELSRPSITISKGFSRSFAS